MAEEEGKTHRKNAGKNMLHLIPWEWIETLGKIFTFGAIKYAPENWKLSLNTSDHEQVKRDRMGSAMRHMLAYNKGERNDPESGEHHLAQASWNLLFIFWYDLYEKKY